MARGRGYDLQRREVTVPLFGRRGSVLSKGVALPQSVPVRALVVHRLGLNWCPIIGTVIPMTFPRTVLSVANDSSDPGMSMNKAAYVISK